MIGQAEFMMYFREKSHDPHKWKDQWLDRVVIITGGARGLGLALARELVVKGAHIAICSRNKEELARAKKDILAHVPAGQVLTYACDVSDAEQTKLFIEAVQKQMGPVDVLINNAGIIQMGPYLNMNEKDFKEVFKSNLWGTINMCESLAPQMVERKNGTIINITSIGGVVPVPHLLPYSASKFGAFGFSTTLHVELHKYGVHVLTVVPWLMRTGSFLNVLLKGRRISEFRLFNFASNSLFVSMNADRAAKKIVRAAERERSVLILGWKAKASRLFFALFPRVTLWILSSADRFLPLPSTQAADSNVVEQGKILRMDLPSRLSTRLGENAAAEYNQSFQRGTKGL
jgi:short-subunit dehydrogenase